MDEFVTAYRAVIELYLLCYNDLLKRGMSPEDATRNAKAIMEIVFSINKHTGGQTND